MQKPKSQIIRVRQRIPTLRSRLAHAPLIEKLEFLIFAALTGVALGLLLVFLWG